VVGTDDGGAIRHGSGSSPCKTYDIITLLFRNVRYVCHVQAEYTWLRAMSMLAGRVTFIPHCLSLQEGDALA
jgi:hypothetical protein